jgi:hypothetical protein
MYKYDPTFFSLSRFSFRGRNRLYRINPHFVADRDNKSLDLGHFVLRLNAGS